LRGLLPTADANMELNLTNLKDLAYICEIALIYYERSYGLPKEDAWRERITRYRTLIQAEIDRLETSPGEQPLQIDPERVSCETGIYVRAVYPADGKIHSVDISELTKESLFAWLRSGGGNNPWAEKLVALLLGYEVDD